jgi:hypothetical protein
MKATFSEQQFNKYVLLDSKYNYEIIPIAFGIKLYLVYNNNMF